MKKMKVILINSDKQIAVIKRDNSIYYSVCKGRKVKTGLSLDASVDIYNQLNK